MENNAAMPSFGVPAAGQQPLTMSSLEIAELVDSRHDKVKQSIERLAERGVIELPPMGEIKETATTPTGGSRTYTTSVYWIGKRDSYVIVAQLSPEFTARLVDRWQELEEEKAGRVALPDFTNPAEAARAWADQLERRQALEIENREQSRQIEDMRPAKEALDRIAVADGSLCITDAAKALQMRPKDLFSWLRQNGWIYKRPGGAHDIGYHSKTASGLLEHKITTVLRADGSEKVTEQVRITPRGLTKLAALVKPPAKLV